MIAHFEGIVAARGIHAAHRQAYLEAVVIDLGFAEELVGFGLALGQGDVADLNICLAAVATREREVGFVAVEVTAVVNHETREQRIAAGGSDIDAKGLGWVHRLGVRRRCNGLGEVLERSDLPALRLGG